MVFTVDQALDKLPPIYTDVMRGPDQTYFGGWNSVTHQLCIGKGGL
jgi:hypothetical protein